MAGGKAWSGNMHDAECTSKGRGRLLGRERKGAVKRPNTYVNEERGKKQVLNFESFNVNTCCRIL